MPPKVVEPTADEKNADAEFLSDGSSPYPSAELLIVVNAALSAATFLSFLAGPPGIVMAALITGGQGLLPLLPTEAGAAARNFAESLKNALHNERVETYLAKSRSFGDWLKTHIHDFEKLDPHSDEYLKDEIQQPLLNDIDASHAGTLYNSFRGLENLMHWDSPDVRVAILGSTSMLLTAYSFLARVYAMRALVAQREGRTKDFDEHRTSFEKTVHILGLELDTRTKAIKAKLDELATWRKGRVTTAVVKVLSGLGNARQRAVYKDEYLPKQPWYKLEYKEFYELPDAVNDRNAYMGRLQSHINRVLKGDYAFITEWEGILTKAKQYLAPQPPKSAPKINGSRSVVTRHPFLDGAAEVSFCYNLSTELGTSANSAETDWIKLEDGKSPVLLIDDGGHWTPTTRNIYHRVKGKAAVNGSATTGGGSEMVLAGSFTASGTVEWVDEFKPPEGH